MAEVDSNDAGLTAGAINLLESTVADWPEAENRLLQGFVPLLKTAWHVQVAWKAGPPEQQRPGARA
jgi:hypothetical protein